MSLDLNASIREIVREELAAFIAQKNPVPHVLTIREACSSMRWSYSWAVRQWPRLGGYRDLDGRLKIRANVLAQHQKTPVNSRR